MANFMLGIRYRAGISALKLAESKNCSKCSFEPTKDAPQVIELKLPVINISICDFCYVRLHICVDRYR